MPDFGNNTVFSETDANNNTGTDPGWPEGMATSRVNDSARALQGASKRFYDWQSSKLTGGTSTAYTLTYDVAPAALYDGMTFLAQFNQTCGASPTLNVNGLGALPINYYSAGSWIAVGSGLITTDMVTKLAYNSGAGAFRILSWPTFPPMTVLRNSVGGGGIPLNNVGVFFDGPVVAQGTAGTWLVMGSVVLRDDAGAAEFQVRLTDGTTIIDSVNTQNRTAGARISASVSGVITSPAGNLRITVNDLTSTSGAMENSSDGTGKSSTITAIRIG
jgi:hypothetical protein